MSCVFCMYIYICIPLLHIISYICALHPTVSSRETSEPTKPQTFFSPSHHQNISSKDNKNNRPRMVTPFPNPQSTFIHSFTGPTYPPPHPIVTGGGPTHAGRRCRSRPHSPLLPCLESTERWDSFFPLPNMMSCEFGSPSRE